MTSMELLELMGSIPDTYVEEAHEEQAPRRLSFRKPLLAAALIAVSLLLVGCAAAVAQGWFGQYFEQSSGQPLSQGQKQYLAENEQVIAESQTQNEWTVELRSAITDGTTGYIIVGITAPEGVNLSPEEVDGHRTESFGPGNSGMNMINMPPDTQRVLTDSLGLSFGGGGSWQEDGDGKDNTKNMVFILGKDYFSANGDSGADPFGADVEYYIHIENIVREYEDQQYLEELLRTKYAGQTDYMLEPDETRRLMQFETLAQGVWDFTVRFDGTTGQRAKPVELLTHPVQVMGFAYREGPPLNEYFNEIIESHEKVTLTSVKLSPLSVTVSYACDVNCRLNPLGTETYVVMKDGRRVETFESGRSTEVHNLVLDPQAPIVLEEVDHVLLPDGTKIPMP